MMNHPMGSWGEENTRVTSPSSLQVIEKQPLLACPACSHYVIMDLHQANVMAILRVALGIVPFALLLAILSPALSLLIVGAIILGFVLYVGHVWAHFDKYRCTSCGFQFSYAIDQASDTSSDQHYLEQPEESLSSVIGPWWER